MSTKDGTLEWIEERREPNTQYVLSCSYGKDSLATIEACRLLHLPLDRIIHAELWFDDDTPAELPPMVNFKSKADAIIKERYGLEVEHVCAMTKPEKKYPYYNAEEYIYIYMEISNQSLPTSIVSIVP